MLQTIDIITKLSRSTFPTNILTDASGNIIVLGDFYKSKLTEIKQENLTIFSIFDFSENGNNFSIPTFIENHAYSLKQIFEYPLTNFSAQITCLDEFYYFNITLSLQLEEENNKTTFESLITERDRMISELQLYKSILDNLPSDIAIFDNQHNYLYINPQGIKNEEIRNFMIGKNDYDYYKFKGLDPSPADFRREKFNQVISTHETVDWEDTHKLENGDYKYVLRRFSYAFNDFKKEAFVIGYGIDITPIKKSQDAINESEKKYRELFENNVSGVFRTTIEGEFIDCNDAYAKIFGFKDKSEIKTNLSANFYVNEQERLDFLKELLKNKQLFNYQIQNKRIDGKIITILVNVKLIEEPDGVYIEGTLNDITDLKEAQSKIQEAEQSLTLYESFLEQSTDAIQVTDFSGNLIYINKVASERLGIPASESKKYSIVDIEKYFETIESWQTHFLKIKESDGITIETQHLNVTTGKTVPVEISVKHRIINGKEYAIASSRDITERFEAAKIIEEKNKFLNDLTDAINASSLVSVTDVNGIISNANDKFCQISGYSREELIGKSHSLINSGYHTHEFWKDFWATILTKKIWRGEICNKTKDGQFYWVNTIIYPILGSDNSIDSFLSIRNEITQAKLNEFSLQKQIGFQELIMKTSTKFINLPEDELEDSINLVLEDIGKFVHADRSYIFNYDHKNKTSSNLFEWCEIGINPEIDNLQNVPFSDMPIWIETHFKGEQMDIPSIESLPEGQLKSLLQIQDIKSLLAIPLMKGKRCIGFIGFDFVHNEQKYREIDRKLLILFGEMLVNIYTRLDYIKEIRTANDLIFNINTNLEKEVHAKTEKNNELTMLLVNQEKLALVGELTAGVAHDLNTPLGAIKISAENVRYTLELLFHKVINNCSGEQLHYACERAQSKNEDFDFYVGGLKALKEQQAISTYLKEQYPNSDKDLTAIADEMVKARIGLSEPAEIERIMSSENPIDFLELIFHIETVRTFISTIMIAGERATEVVKNLRSFINQNSNNIKTKVNINENINTVLNIFNHEIKHKVKLTFDVDPQLYIIGYDVKLFQLWSNLVKNAIEAMERNGELIIKSKETNEHIIISVANSGAKIPDEIFSQMFEKYFTTKNKQNGTGLGLSIVRSVIDEHHAKIHVDSSEKLTIFTVTFEKNIAQESTRFISETLN